MLRFASETGTDFVEMERDRRGETTIQSISPNELTLRSALSTERVHMAIDGSTGHHVQAEDGKLWHAVQFGFKFDPGQLTVAANEEWVKRNALS